jgi:hypothetical protein
MLDEALPVLAQRLAQIERPRWQVEAALK